ncbi:hypothetical protein CEB3_c19560 [Peptococcaceae bacterium CEB3]|nr:hypothetical protein CEB3_c19560 [Peptococcaceae bacterium CEB3]
MIKRDRGSVGIYILMGVFVTCFVFAAVFWGIAGEITHIRQVALTDMQQAGRTVLYQAAEYNLATNEYTITWTPAQLEQLFNQKMTEQGFTKYTLAKFEVLHKGDKDLLGDPLAQPGLYIEIDLPLAGHEVPVGQDFVVPPYNNATGQYPR